MAYPALGNPPEAYLMSPNQGAARASRFFDKIIIKNVQNELIINNYIYSDYPIGLRGSHRFSL